MSQADDHSVSEAAARMPGAARAVLSDGRRQHFHHGPIDLVIEAFGAADDVSLAYDQAWRIFETVLGDLVGELPVLRTDAAERPTVAGRTARRMVVACDGHGDVYVTPMAAVAGAVADEILAAMIAGRPLAKAYVNNGGDIALHLSKGQSFKTGMVTLGETPAASSIATIAAGDGVGGIATSGWRGRSLSLGIADSVTVLDHNEAAADVAATLIANAINVVSSAITRTPARELDPDSDLGDRLVTTAVGDLTPSDIDTALAAGLGRAEALVDEGKILAASLTLLGQHRIAADRHAPVSDRLISTPDRRAIAA